MWLRSKSLKGSPSRRHNLCGRHRTGPEADCSSWSGVGGGGGGPAAPPLWTNPPGGRGGPTRRDLATLPPSQHLHGQAGRNPWATSSSRRSPIETPSLSAAAAPMGKSFLWIIRAALFINTTPDLPADPLKGGRVIHFIKFFIPGGHKAYNASHRT